MPLLDEECRVNVRPKHQCSSKREVPIDCLDSYGELKINALYFDDKLTVYVEHDPFDYRSGTQIVVHML